MPSRSRDVTCGTMHPVTAGLPHDTDEAAQAIQDRVYLAMSGAERVAIAFRLAAAARDLTKAGIRHRHPSYSDDQVHMALMRIIHGDDVVLKVWPDRELVEP